MNGIRSQDLPRLPPAIGRPKRITARNWKLRDVRIEQAPFAWHGTLLTRISLAPLPDTWTLPSSTRSTADIVSVPKDRARQALTGRESSGSLRYDGPEAPGIFVRLNTRFDDPRGTWQHLTPEEQELFSNTLSRSSLTPEEHPFANWVGSRVSDWDPDPDPLATAAQYGNDANISQLKAQLPAPTTKARVDYLQLAEEVARIPQLAAGAVAYHAGDKLLSLVDDILHR